EDPVDRRRRDRQRRVRGRLRRGVGRLADPRTAVYRRGHGRRAAPPDPIVTAVDPSAWDRFVEASDPGSYLQMSAWARVKAVNGWTAHTIETGAGAERIGAQVLVRRPRPMPWGFAYAPRGPVAGSWDAAALGAFTTAVRGGLPATAGGVSHV